MQVYLPDNLHRRVRARGGHLNVSAILQAALSLELDRLERLEALGRAVRSYETEAGAFSQQELDDRERQDQEQAPPARARRRRRKAA